MAQIDDQRLQLTIGIVGVGSAPVDLLIHQGRKLGLDREMLEAVPVVRFGLRGEVLGLPLVVVMSAAPLDVVQADAVVAVNDGESGLAELLDRFDLLPLDASQVTLDRLAGAGREHDPILVLLNAGGQQLAMPGFTTANVDLATGEGISAAINPVVSRAASLLAAGERTARACPTLVLHATHKPASPADLHPAAFPRPGARIHLRVSLHEPFGDGDWDCAFDGVVDAAMGPHVVQGTIEPAGDVPDELDGRWTVELFREHEIWILRSMVPAS